jgi:hypothetical protein
MLPNAATMTTIRPLALALAVGSPWPAAGQQSAAPPDFDHRKLIAENLPKLFAAEAQARNIAVSELRRVPSPAGLTWGTCVRVNATGISGQPTLPRTYVVTFSRTMIAERRQASDADCAGAAFAPLR